MFLLKIDYMKLVGGFQLLKTRKVEEKIDLQKIEDQFGFSLPPLYRLFVSTFHLGKGTFEREVFLNPLRNELYDFKAPLYYPLEADEKWFLSVSYFDTIEQIYMDWSTYMKKEKEWMEYGFIRIAGIGQGGGLFIGTRPENVDVVFEVIWDFEEPYFKVADNILELMKGFTFTENNKPLADGFLSNQLYKQWDENFWRVRE